MLAHQSTNKRPRIQRRCGSPHILPNIIAKDQQDHLPKRSARLQIIPSTTTGQAWFPANPSIFAASQVQSQKNNGHDDRHAQQFAIYPLRLRGPTPASFRCGPTCDGGGGGTHRCCCLEGQSSKPHVRQACELRVAHRCSTPRHSHSPPRACLQAAVGAQPTSLPPTVPKTCA